MYRLIQKGRKMPSKTTLSPTERPDTTTVPDAIDRAFYGACYRLGVSAKWETREMFRVGFAAGKAAQIVEAEKELGRACTRTA